MPTGKVKTIKTRDNGSWFGFIEREGGADIYFDKSGAGPAAAHTFKVGDQVTFMEISGSNGPKADQVRPAASSGGAPAPPPPPRSLPDDCVFQTFYGEDGRHLDKRLFFEAAQKMAAIFERAKVTRTQYRQIYSQFLDLIIYLRANEADHFPAASERFCILYVERVERGVNRKVLPPVVKEFFDRHRGQALRDAQGLKGFFRYFTNILCYTKQ